MRIWIERGFSRLPIAERMLATNPGLQLFTSPSQAPNSATPLIMPHVPAEQVAQVVDQIVREHHIDVFWPQYAARQDLTGVSCTVHAAGTPETISLVDDKMRFMEWMDADEMRPDQIEAETLDDVQTLYAERMRQGRDTCVKPAIGVNGRGYWRFVANDSRTLLDEPDKREIDFSVWAAAAELDEMKNGPRRMLVMDWLPGPEVSVDLLCWHGVPLIHAARVKIDANHQQIQSRHPVIDHAHDVATRLKLHGMVSMQYRLDSNGNWKMLEVNPRPAGGVIHSEDAGFRIISTWTRLVSELMDASQCRQVDADVRVRFTRSAEVVTN